MGSARIGRLSLDGHALLLDVSVTHPTSPSALKHHLSARPLGAAKAREYYKIHKYEGLAADEGASVIPLGMETTGAMGLGFQEFSRRLSLGVRGGECSVSWS